MHTTHIDYLIIGAGPSWLQMGYFLQQKKQDYLILESRDQPGAFFETFPRHRKLISINKVYTGYTDPEVNLRWDWNSLLSDDERLLFKHYSSRYFPDAADLSRYLYDFAHAYKLNVAYNQTVRRVSRNGNFLVHTAEGNVYTARVLLIATGLYTPYLPPIPGIELAEVYTTVSVIPEDFTNQRVLIIGKGNSAFEVADNLVETAALIHLVSPHSLRMAWTTHYVGHLRAVNNNILDTYQLKSQNALLDADVQKIELCNGQYMTTFVYAHAEGEIEQISYDRVIACTGFRFDASIFDESCQPALSISERFPALTSDWESTTVPDLYFIGTLMQMRDYKRYMSGFIHGFRYNIRTLSRILAWKYHQTPLPRQILPVHPQFLTDYILSRINRSSGLWQQPGYLYDLIEIDSCGQEASYFEELSLGFIWDRFLFQSKTYLLIALEYGDRHGADPFSTPRAARDNARRAADSHFLHPIVRMYVGRDQTAEHHVIEDLAAEWKELEHSVPLREFLTEHLQLTTLGRVAVATNL